MSVPDEECSYSRNASFALYLISTFFMYIFFIPYRILNIKTMAKTNFCAGSLVKEAKPIKWIDIQTAFYLIGIGTIFGIFILGSEFLLSKCRSKKNSKCNTSFCNKVSEWIWSLIWIFEYWCRWIFHVWCQWIQRLMSVNSNADVEGFYGWCQWIQMQISVNSTVKCQWIQRLVSVNSTVGVSEFST